MLRLSKRLLQNALTSNNPKIPQLVSEISSLSLIDTAVLVQELRIKLNIKDMPIIQSAPQAAPKEEAKEEKKAVKSAFQIVISKVDGDKKAKIIRELKQMMGWTLVDAKKFVESVPGTVKKDVVKEEAEEIKKKLEGVGATVKLE
eukprot:NODE_73_length_24441_cov_0.672952.p17 type:complete len:145 gc:universal NODE_73_length_24441_cov_0.672952:14069-14503(+)